MRFEGYGWHTQRVDDGNDLDALDAALRAAQGVTDRPSLIAVRSIIGFGAPNRQGTSEAHGNPLGPDELKAAKANLGWPIDGMFNLPGEALENFRQALDRGAEAEAAWTQRLAAYTKLFPSQPPSSSGAWPVSC